MENEKSINKNNHEEVEKTWAKMSEEMGSFDEHKERDIKKIAVKVYDAELNEVDNPIVAERVQSMLGAEVDFLVEKYGIDKDLLQTRRENVSVVEWRLGTGFSAIYNGEKRYVPKGDTGPAAFCAHMEQLFDGDSWSFKEAVYFDNEADDSTLSHELFHALSTKNNMSFNDNGIGYNKSGVSIDGYNKEDKVVDSSFRAEGLNEGITELLSTKFYSQEKPDVYDAQVYLSDILISPNNGKLLTAYFSNDEGDFRDFLIDFGQRQNILPSDALVKLSKDDVFLSTDFITACTEYVISYCNDIDQLKAERKRIIPIVDRIIEHNRSPQFDNMNDNGEQIVNSVKNAFSMKRGELVNVL